MPFDVIDVWIMVAYNYINISNILDIPKHLHEFDTVDELVFFIMKMLLFSLNIFKRDGCFSL